MARCLASTLTLTMLLSACAGEEDQPPPPPSSPDPVDYATLYTEAGAWPVGHAVLEAPRAGLPALEVKAWYPAAPSTSGSDAIAYPVRIKLPGFPEDPQTITGAAYPDAAPDTDGGPFPLVVLSHGFGTNPEWYHGLAEHLASHGFVVLGPEHVEHDWFTEVIEASVARLEDVSATIDLAEGRPLQGIVDVERVLVLGHSYGGYTALAAAGARIDMTGLAERCESETRETELAFFCDPFLSGAPALAERMGLPEPPDGLWPALAEPRVDAIVSMAGDAFMFGPEGLASVRVPTLVLGGTADSASPWDWGAGLTFDSISSPDRTLVALEGAEHFVVTAPCEDMPWTAGLPAEYQALFCEDPAWDKAEGLRVTNHFVTAFAKHTLEADAQAREALEPAHYSERDRLDVRR